MKKLFSSRPVSVAAAIILPLSLIAFVFSAFIVRFAEYDSWYQNNVIDFSGTHSCFSYVYDANYYVIQNVQWKSDMNQDFLGSYAGSAYSYVIYNSDGNKIMADTRTDDSIHVLDTEAPSINDMPDFYVSGYINLPVKPYGGCYLEFFLFKTFYPLRFFLKILKYVSFALGLLSFSFLCLHIVRNKKERQLPAVFQNPIELTAVFSAFFGVLFYNILISYVEKTNISWEMAESTRIVLKQLFFCLVIGLNILIGISQFRDGILRKRSVFSWVLRYIPISAVLTVFLLLHAVLLFVVWKMDIIDYFSRLALLIIPIAIDFILIPVVIIYTRNARIIQNASRELSGGNLTYKTDTEKLHLIWRDLGHDLNSIGTAMTNAVEDRMKSERMKTELITNVSHDLKTPITSIVNYVGLLKTEGLDEQKRKQYLDVLDRQSARLKKLTEDVIEASKAASGALQAELEEIDAVELLEQTIGEYEGRLRDSHIEPVLTVSAQEAFIRADSTLLGRILDNILMNVLKYAQPDTRAYFDLYQNGGQIAIAIKNISREPLNISPDELMERFVRGDSSRHTEGSGLGLSIARSLAELMNGKMTLLLDGDLFKTILEFPATVSTDTESE